MKLSTLLLCLLLLGRLGAQDYAPDSVANMIMVTTGTSGFQTPPLAALLCSDGMSYSLDGTEAALGRGIPYTWTKTGPNTGFIESGSGPVKGRTTMTLGAGLFGIYQNNLGGGTITLQPFASAINPPLRNLSYRTTLAPGQSSLAGFVVSGKSPRRVLLRAIGPSLANFGVTQPAKNLVLTAFGANGVSIAQNSAWGGGADIAAVFLSVGAFALPAASQDCALVMVLEPGNYTAQVKSAAGGEALVEVYFVN